VHLGARLAPPADKHQPACRKPCPGISERKKGGLFALPLEPFRLNSPTQGYFHDKEKALRAF
ncbi:hypothetical protein U6J64_12325, partial [Cutibacterium acnes]